MPIRSRPHHAPVHFNADNTLMVIPNLVEERFGIQKPRQKKAWIGTCLVAQVAFTISSITGIPPMPISRHILLHLGHEGSAKGFTLEQILETFDAPVLTRQGPVWLKLGVSAYNSESAMILDVMQGHPVIVIVPREAGDALESEAASYRDGQSYATVIRPAKADLYHSYLAIGFEVKSDLSPAEFLILRDSRSEYCHKGYLKIGTNILHEGWRNIGAFSVNVLEVER